MECVIKRQTFGVTLSGGNTKSVLSKTHNLIAIFSGKLSLLLTFG